MGVHNVNIYSDDSSLVIGLTSAFSDAPCRLFLCRDRSDLLVPEVMDTTDILLVDELLAQVDTWSMAQRFRQAAGERPVVVIGLVGTLRNELLDRSKEVGVDAFMLKRQVGTRLPAQVAFVARAVPMREETHEGSVFLTHEEFVEQLKSLVEVIEAAPGASSPGELRPGVTAIWKEKRGEVQTVTRFRRSRSSGAGGGTTGGGPEGEIPVLEGTYFSKVVLGKLLGRGGGGAVFQGRHTSLDMPVAVKVLYPNLVEKDPEFAARFLAEARTAARMQVGGVVRVFDCDRDPDTGCYYIVMEYVEGSSLQEEITRSGRLPERRLTELALEITGSLRVAEDLGIVHRDLKPENILISTEGLVKLADLGLAKQVEAAAGLGTGRLKVSSKSPVGKVMGTPYYIAPEQINDPASIDSRADIYSLGATLYHAAVGQVPFPGENFSEIFFHHLNTQPIPVADRNPAISQEFSGIVSRMMAKRPRQRYSSCRELHGVLLAHRDLLVVQGAGSTSGRRPTTGGRPK